MASIEACKDMKVETDDLGKEKEKERTDEEGSLLSKKRKQPEGDEGHGEGSRKDKGKEKIKEDDEQKEKEKETEERKNKRAKLADILAESQEANEERKQSQGEGINAECPICMDEFPTMAMIPLQCGHMYCRYYKVPLTRSPSHTHARITHAHSRTQSLYSLAHSHADSRTHS